MGLIDVLIPLVAGVYVLLVPIRAKSAEETAEQLAKRRKQVRLAGVLLISVAGGYFLITQTSPKPVKASEPVPFNAPWLSQDK